MKTKNQPTKAKPTLPIMIRYNLLIQHKQDENFFEVTTFATLAKARRARQTFCKSFDSIIKTQIFTNQGWKDKRELESELERIFNQN